MKQSIFVFGSNLAGRHIKGDALTAYRQHGAIYGEAVGLHGDSYAIPTKDENLKSLPLNKISQYINGFIKFSKLNSDIKFIVTRIGCGFAEYEDSQIAPLFNDAPANCILPVGWRTTFSNKLQPVRIP